MVVLLFFAFLAGIFTVLSPCILPVLPILLSAGTAQGRLRPLGIIVGLVMSFSFFTLVLSALVHLIGLSPTVLRNGAIGLIFFFGLVMVFPALSNWFAKLTGFIASAGQKLQPAQSVSGFWGGFLLGIALGLLWTPCAGPILATITALVATHAISLVTVLMTLSYSFGAGIPLFLIAYASGKVIRSSQVLSRHAEQIRRFFGILMICFAFVLAFHWDMLLEQKLMRYLPRSLVETNPHLEKELKKLRGETAVQGTAPELVGITGWINSPPLSIEELKGKVVLVDFWTYSCINCLRTIPYLEKWDRLYRDKGLVIIGVHTPEFAFEKQLENVKKAVEQLGIDYPVALDNDYETWRAYHNNYWPAHYLIDQEGNIYMVHYGEGAYVETENGIRALLALAPLAMQETQGSTTPITSETYLGAARGHSYENTVKRDQIVDYAYTPPLGEDRVGLTGPWQVEDESILAAGDGCTLDLNFLAKQVYLVLAGESNVLLRIYLDGRLVKELKVDADQKYDIVDTKYGRHLLSIQMPAGIRAYAFTFGDE